MASTDSVPLYTAAQSADLDRIASADFGVPAAALMRRAGEAAFAVLRRRWPDAARIAVVCGVGNNGGDGYVVARLAREHGLAVTVLQLGEAVRQQGAAAAALAALGESGVQPQPFDATALPGADLVVDALLGTGLARPVAGEWHAAIDAVNGTGLPVLALDIPSGLAADTGQPLGTAVRASATVTFIGRKRGLYTGAGPAFTGAVEFASLDVPAAVHARVDAGVELLTAPPLGPLASPRPRDAHKGRHGHVLVVGGDQGMGGAARLAGEAALRVGAGLVSLATRPEHAAALTAARPELMCHGVGGPQELEPLLARATVVAVGPGLGQGAWGRALWEAVLAAGLPLVVDADALNLLAAAPRCRDDWVLTPHPGEAARLLGSDAAAVQADRFAALADLTARYGGVVVLKGAGSLVGGAGGPVAVCRAGNPGMAAGGMGDLLTGVIAGLRAQGLDPLAAARAGVCVHAAAGDRAARDGERGLLAGDVLAALRRQVNP